MKNEKKSYTFGYWSLEITKVRIKFWNYLFKAEAIHHLEHNRIFPADRIGILL